VCNRANCHVNTRAAYQLIALLLTIIVEGIGMAAVSWAAPGLRSRLWRNLAATVGINLLVHPIFWLALVTIQPAGLWTLYGLEAAVVLIEAALYVGLRGFAPRQAVGISLLLNMLSFVVGITFWMARAF
jgi:hypothetical protein